MNSDQKQSGSESTEELDLAIPDMHSEVDGEHVKFFLKKLPGIDAVRLVPKGAWIRYDPRGIQPDVICEAIKRAGFRACIFQDSLSCRTAVSPQ